MCWNAWKTNGARCAQARPSRLPLRNKRSTAQVSHQVPDRRRKTPVLFCPVLFCPRRQPHPLFSPSRWGKDAGRQMRGRHPHEHRNQSLPLRSPGCAARRRPPAEAPSAPRRVRRAGRANGRCSGHPGRNRTFHLLLPNLLFLLPSCFAFLDCFAIRASCSVWSICRTPAFAEAFLSTLRL